MKTQHFSKFHGYESLTVGLNVGAGDALGELVGLEGNEASIN